MLYDFFFFAALIRKWLFSKETCACGCLFFPYFCCQKVFLLSCGLFLFYLCSDTFDPFSVGISSWCPSGCQLSEPDSQNFTSLLYSRWTWMPIHASHKGNEESETSRKPRLEQCLTPVPFMSNGETISILSLIVIVFVSVWLRVKCTPLYQQNMKAIVASVINSSDSGCPTPSFCHVPDYSAKISERPKLCFSLPSKRACNDSHHCTSFFFLQTSLQDRENITEKWSNREGRNCDSNTEVLFCIASIRSCSLLPQEKN